MSKLHALIPQSDINNVKPMSPLKIQLFLKLNGLIFWECKFQKIKAFNEKTLSGVWGQVRRLSVLGNLLAN